MRSRILSGLLVVIMLLQSWTVPVYATGSSAGVEAVEEMNIIEGAAVTEVTESLSVDETDILTEEGSESIEQNNTEEKISVEENSSESVEESYSEEITTEEMESTSVEDAEELTEEESEVLSEKNGVEEIGEELETTMEETVEETTEEVIQDIELEIFSEQTDLAEIQNVYVEGIGYQRARIVFEVVCTEGVSATQYGGVVCSESTLSTYDKAYFNTNASNQYYIDVNVQPGKKLTYFPYIYVTTASDSSEQKVEYSSGIEIEGVSFDNLNPTIDSIDSGVLSAFCSVGISEYDYNVDYNFLDMIAMYRQKGDTEWSSYTDYGKKCSNDKIEMTIRNLEENTEYEVYFLIEDSNGTDSSVQTDVSAFTTDSDVTYSQEDFPDEVFYEHLMYYLENSEDTTQITQSVLDKITSIYLSPMEDYSVWGTVTEPISSLEGIQYLRNLKTIDISGQDIEDVSQISSLTQLEKIYLDSNKLKKLPDMSKMENLEYIDFYYNHIPVSEITEDKLPQKYIDEKGSYDQWTRLAQYQVGETTDIIEIPICYGWNDTHPFICGATNLKFMPYRTVLTVDGKEYEYVPADEDYYNIYGGNETHIEERVIPDTGLACGTYENATVVIYDWYDRKIAEKEIDFEIKDDEASIEVSGTTVYSESISVDLELPGVTSDITNVELVKDEVVYGTGNVSYAWQEQGSGWDDRYGQYFGGYILCSDWDGGRSWLDYDSTIEITTELESGKYDIRVSFEDGTQQVFEDVVDVTASARIYSVEMTYGSQCLNTKDSEYVYIRVGGSNIEKDKIYPQLYSGEKLVTESLGVIEETVDVEGIEYYTYKLKKLEKNAYWNKGRIFRWDICAADGYTYVNHTSDCWIDYYFIDGLDISLVWIDEIRTKDSVQIVFDTEIADGTTIDVEIYADNYPSKLLKGSGSSTVENQVLKLDFYDEDGNIWHPECGTNMYDFHFVITNNNSEKTYINENLYIYSTPGGYYESAISSNFIMTLILGSTDSVWATTFKGFSLGKLAELPLTVSVYALGTNEKVLSIDVTESMLDKNKCYLFEQEHIDKLQKSQVYRVEIHDRDSERLLKRFFGYLEVGETSSVPVVKPTKITLNKSNVTMGISETLSLTATVTPKNASNRTVTWGSSNESVVSVDSSGNIIALQEGTAVITASTHNGLTASCKITVYQSEGEAISIKPDEEYIIEVPEFVNVKSAKFTSADTTIATVDKTGLVSGVGLGETEIILQANTIKIVYKVTVTNPLQSIAFEDASVTIEEGQTVTNGIIYMPSLTDSNKEITVQTDDSEIVRVSVAGRSVKIEALKAGTATVTANVGELQTACQVTVLSVVSVPDLSENEVYAFLNHDKTLSDLEDQLPEGFSFVEQELQLSKFAGVSEKEFAVTYVDANNRPAETVQKVKFISISEIQMNMDKESVEADGIDCINIQINYVWSGYEASTDVKNSYLDDYTTEISMNKQGLASIEATDDGYVLKGLSKGNVTLIALLREKGSEGKTGILFKTTGKVVVADNTANLEIAVEGAAYNAEKDYYIIEDIEAASLYVKGIAEGYKVKWTSSDTAIAAIGKTVDDKTSITIKSNGKVKLTATATDTAKTNKSIMLYVIDTKPSIDDQVTINKALENGGTMGIYASYGYEISQYDVQIMKNDNLDESDRRFMIDYNSQKDIYEVCLSDSDNLKEGKYKVNVMVTADVDGSDRTYYQEVTITVVNKPVTYSYKQNEKVNLFYNDEEGNGSLGVTGKNAVMESVELIDCDFEFDYESGELSFTGDDYENPDKEGTLIIKFSGYKEVTKDIKIATVISKPKLKISASSSVLYPNAGIKIAKIQVTNSADGSMYTVENSNINQESLETDSYRVYAKEGEVYYALKESVSEYPKSAKITFKLQMDNWNDEIAISHTIKSNSAQNPAVSLSNSTITLNKNGVLAKYQTEEVTMKVKNVTDVSIDSVAVSGADKKSVSAMNTGMDFAFEEESGKLSVWFNDSSDVKTGTYTYNLKADVAEGSNANTKLKVKVIDKNPVTSVTVNTKGSIDIVDRENTSVICTPKFTNISGKVVDVRLTGEDAHLFNVSLNDSGLAEITAREDAAYITKYAYKIQLVYTLNSGDRDYEVTSKVISIKVNQGKISATAQLDSALLYQAADNALNLTLETMNKNGKELEIREVALVETKALKDAFALVYNESAECHKLSINDVSKLKKNKNYTLKMLVWTKEQADNEKPITLSVKVKVK